MGFVALCRNDYASEAGNEGHDHDVLDYDL